MTSSPDGRFWILVNSMARAVYAVWRKGRALPEALKALTAANALAPPNAPSLGMANAFYKARRAEYMRLASSIHYVRVPHLSRPPTGERLVLSMPVSLYESRENRLMKHMSYVQINRSNDLIHAHPTGSSKRERLVLVDRGTLMVTHRRMLFTSPRRMREFPLGELTFFSTTWSSIALAARWRFGISYFHGLSATRLRFNVEPEGDETWPTIEYAFSITGEDIKEIVRILQAAPILNRS